MTTPKDGNSRDVQAERRREARAVLAVLGDPAGLLSEDQRTVWAFIRRNGFLEATTIRSDPSGRLDAERMLLNEGGRLFALHFLDAIRFSQEPEDAPNVPPEPIR